MAQTRALYQLKKACRIDACVHAYISWRAHLWRGHVHARVHSSTPASAARVSFQRTHEADAGIFWTHAWGSTRASFVRMQGGWRAYLLRVHLRRVHL